MSNRPKPVEIKKLEGNRGHRKIKKQEKSIPIKDDPPKWLSKEGKKAWLEKAEELYRMGLLTKLSKTAFEILCNTYAKWREAAEFDIKSLKGRITKKDKLAIEKEYRIRAMQYGKELRMLLIEFGMTPAALGKVTVTKEDEKDPFMEVFKDGG